MKGTKCIGQCYRIVVQYFRRLDFIQNKYGKKYGKLQVTYTKDKIEAMSFTLQTNLNESTNVNVHSVSSLRHILHYNVWAKGSVESVL